jgi:hypothetical protein
MQLTLTVNIPVFCNAEISADITQLVFAGWIPLLATLYLTKAAIITFYFAIFPSEWRTFRYLLWTVVVYIALSFIVSTLVLFTICLPLHTHW